MFTLHTEMDNNIVVIVDNIDFDFVPPRECTNLHNPEQCFQQQTS